MDPSLPVSNNFASLVQEATRRHSDRPALVLPDFRRLKGWEAREQVTFGEFWQRVSGFARALEAAGVRPRQRVLLAVPLSADLYALALAVMAAGATVVLVDAGLDRKRLIHCIKAARLDALVGAPRLLRLRFIVPALWRIPLKLATGGGGIGLRRLERGASPEPIDPVQMLPSDTALITFTSGSTGEPKGANRLHDVLIHQHVALRRAFPPREDEVSMTCFPVVALHNLCCGVTTVLPAIDFRDVGAGKAAWILRQMAEYDVGTLTGGPAFIRSIIRHCTRDELTLPRIERLGVGGAPVGRPLCRDISAVFPRAEARVIYGSTEAEPVASISVSEVLDLHRDGYARGLGYPGGRVHEATRVRIIPVTEGPLDGLPGEVAEGEWGEVVVSGRHVVPAYFKNPTADANTKVQDADGTVWHRMGDVGRRDEAGRLWLGGRAERLVEARECTLHPLRVEALLEEVPGLRRSALHAHRGRIVLWVEPESEGPDPLPAIGAALAAEKIAVDDVLTVDAIPVDRRHRSKVDYDALDKLAARRITRIDPHRS